MSLKRIITSVAVTSSVALPVALPAATFATTPTNTQKGLINVDNVHVLNGNDILSNNQLCTNVGLLDSLLQKNNCKNLVF